MIFSLPSVTGRFVQRQRAFDDDLALRGGQQAGQFEELDEADGGAAERVDFLRRYRNGCRCDSSAGLVGPGHFGQAIQPVQRFGNFDIVETDGGQLACQGGRLGAGIGTVIRLVEVD